MSVLRFLVQGSEPDPYEVVFAKAGNSLTATCTCRAGQVRQQCKHRIQLLYGQVDGLVGGNESDVLVLADWLKGSELEHVLAELGEAEKRVEDAQRVVSAMKKKMARILNG